MSNRDSMGFGDLLPQDVVEIFAQDKHGKRGRKKRSHSLGRALGWLKGKKRKDLGANGQSLGLGPALDLALDVRPAGHQGGHKGGQKSGRQAHPQGNSHAVPKRDNDDKTPAPPLVQENVFIEASRPKYLEDLHTEAQEGLKMMQQEETDNGVEYQDNESTISTMTVQTDGNGEGFMTDSTIPDTSSVVSGQSSTRSSRSGLTRQGSTFRPLNSGKNPEKAKTRRRHRKTVVGIPQHVQRELGLDRVGWTLSSKVEEEQLFNGEIDDSPTTDGPQLAAESQKGASASLQDMNVIQPLRKHQVEQLCATHAGHRDDLALLHRLGPDFSGGQRPRSLAVPWMTTANSLQQQPPSPVMSMSPQAPYMSKIIPNAVLPPSIEVVEISRGRSRNSLRTVSKSSLLLSSPAPSRASSRASSSRTTSSRASNITSASRYNPPHLSDSSCWSNSQSSETLVSDDSTISSSSTPRQKRSQDGYASAKEDKVSVHSSISKASKCTSNGKLISKGDNTKDEGPFVRSLSVMKPKRAPPPPNRSYSLHNKMKRRSRDLAEARIISGESSLRNISASGETNKKNEPGSSPVSLRDIDSPDYNADTSSLDDSTGSVSFSPFKSQLQALKTEEAAKVEETKDASIEKQEPLKENKPSKMISPSSGYSSQDGTSPQLSKPPHSSSPRHKRGILAKLQRLFPGSTHAAPAPSPLTQPEAPENTKSTDDPSVDTVSVSPSVRALRELFNIPPPPKIHAPPPPPPEVWAHNKRTFELLLGPPAPDNTYAIIKKNPKDRRQQRQSPSSSAEGSVKSLVGERKQKNPTIIVEAINGPLHVLETKEAQESGLLNAEILKENNERLVEQNDLKGSSKVTEKDEKVRVSEMLSGMVVKAAEKRGERLAAMKEEEAKKTSTQATEVNANMDTLPAISLVRISPSPSPPPVDHPPRPPAQQTTEVASVTSGQTVMSPESSWPPPPPAMDQVGFSGADDIDFPIPPPPLFCEERLVIPVQVPTERSIPDAANIEQVSSSTSVVSVVNTECVKETTEPETRKTSSSQGLAPPPLNIPPPPSYTAPPPPLKAVSPPMTKEVILPPPKDFSPPPPAEHYPPAPKKVSPLPPKKVSPLPPKEVSPLPPKKVSPLPPKKVSPPPPKEVSPLPPKKVSPLPPKKVSPPPPKEVSPPLPKEVNPLPSKEVSPPPPNEVSPLPHKDVSPPPPKEVSPLPPEEVSPPPPNKVSPPPPKEVSPLPPKEVSPLPPIEVSPLPPEEVSPPPSIELSLPPEDVSPPPPIEVSPLPPKEVSPPPPIEVSPLPPEEVSPPPSIEVSLPPEEVSPPPSIEVSSLPPEEVSLPPPKEEASPVMPKESSPPLDQVSPTLINVVSPPPAIEVSIPPAEEVTPPSCQENVPQSSEEASPVSKLCPPQCISPPPIDPEPPLQSQPQSTEEELDVPLESIPSESETNPISCTSILTPPQSIPPPPPLEFLPPSEDAPLNTDGLATQEASPSLPHEASIPPALETTPSPPANILLSPPLPVQGLASIKDQPSPASTENQSPEPPSAPVVQEQPSPIVTPSLLQMVKLRSANSSPEPPKAQEQAQAEVTMRHKQPSNQVLSSSANGEAPQKPIRKSLIMTSPPIITSEPALPTSKSVVVSPASSTTVVSPTKKSPPAMTISPSMNLQEAIRLRTAARSKDGPASRLSLHSPTSPIDSRKSPSSTASFVFSKSSKTVVIETKPTVEAVETSQKNLEVSSVTKGVKMPPPVAKKPKAKAKETETSEGTEQTAGQEAQPESIRDTLEKTIRIAAGTVEGGDR